MTNLMESLIEKMFNPEKCDKNKTCDEENNNNKNNIK